MSVEAHSSDVEQLHRMGYAQELMRRMGTFSNFAVSFTIISILSGCLTLYAYGMNTGGPVIMNIGWPLVGIMVTLVGLAMAEVCSSYPTAGGLYYWAAKLGGNNSAAWSWFTGWFNLLGQIAVTAGIDFGGAFFMSALFNQLFNYTLDPPHIIAVYAVILFLHGLLNTFGVRLVALLNDISVWWHLVGVAIIFLVLFFLPSHHQSAGFVFTRPSPAREGSCGRSSSPCSPAGSCSSPSRRRFRTTTPSGWRSSRRRRSSSTRSAITSARSCSSSSSARSSTAACRR